MTAPLVTDLAIVGSGFGGSLLALIARRLGLRVALLERGRHPRFAIGESASPLAGVVLEQLADRYDLPRIRPLAAYGTWTRTYPDVGCGLKRGFTYYKQVPGRRFASARQRSNQLLVAASPSDELSDTHWLRADVDHFLVRQAVDAGASYIDALALDALEWGPGGEPRLSGVRRGVRHTIHARFLVDATGPRGFLARMLPISESGFDSYPETQALFSHFTGVARCADMPEYADADAPPYPPDAAALHHVFDEGWMWVLRFDNGVTSAGVAVTDACAAELKLADGEPAWRRLLDRYPSVRAQFAGAQAIREFTWMPRVAYRAEIACGDRWALLPSAAAFVDPLFSTGIPMTLLGVERLARSWNHDGHHGHDVFGQDRGDRRGRRASEFVLAEADHTARFIAACYALFPRFERFVDWSMVYFAAASFSEMSRRLHGDTWSRGFLLAQDPAVVDLVRRRDPESVAAAIASINVAGLADPAKRNWYGVDVEDAVRAAGKLSADADRIRELFAAT